LGAESPVSERVAAQAARARSPDRPVSLGEFQRLIEETHGPDILDVRNEFFSQQAGRKRLRGAVSGVANLGRELRWLLRPGPAADLRSADVIAILTQARAIGVETLRPALAEARAAGIEVAVIRHPRVAAGADPEAAVLRLVRPLAVLKAFFGALPYLRPGHPRLSRLLAYTLMVRLGLLRAACRASLGGYGGVLLLHGDCEVVVVAALDAVADRRRSICLQHGVLGDRFFPPHANAQVVWGESSADVARGHGVAADRIVIDSLGRDLAVADPAGRAPERVLLISQTHTRDYGLDLRPGLKALAMELRAEAPGLPLMVLLHPSELRTHPYDEADGLVLQRPPHPELASDDSGERPPSLVIGFSSTALLDAAAAGHYVIGIDWTPTTNMGACSMARPPMQVADAAGVVEAFQRLGRDKAFRRELAAGLRDWVARTYAPRDPSGGDGPFLERLKAMLGR